MKYLICFLIFEYRRSISVSNHHYFAQCYISSTSAFPIDMFVHLFLTTTSFPYSWNSRHARDVHYFSSPRIDYAIVKNQLRSSSPNYLGSRCTWARRGRWRSSRSSPMEEKGGTFRHEEEKKEVDKIGRNLFQVTWK